MSRIKLLTFTTLYPNQAQPIHGVFVEQRLRHLLVQKDFEAQVVAPVPWFPARNMLFGRYAKFACVPSEEQRHGVRVLHPRYPLIPKVGMTTAPFLMAGATYSAVRALLADGYDFDIIDAHYFYPDGVAAAFLAKKVNRPFVITARGSDINLIARYSIPRKLMLAAARAAAGVVTVSEALKASLIRMGVPEERIIVLPNGVDLKLFKPVNRSACKKELGVNGLTLLSVGQLHDFKGHDIAIRALAQLSEVTLLIVGDGNGRRRLQSLAKSRDVEHRVIFLGTVRHEQLKNCYAAADALVLASAREGWPNVLLESMACGTPVIATNVGGVPEIVRAPEAGIIMRGRTPEALVDAYHALHSHYPARAAVRRYAEQFSWDATALGQATLFRQIKEHCH
jgi:glycosyltransferase involved in cell wall biosynthesis